MGDQVIISALPSAEGYVELSTTHPKARGRVFRKHVLNLGDLHYGGKTYKLDEDWYGKLKTNFDAGVSMCQVPLADADNKHSEHPLANTGEVIGVERQGKKVYTLVDIRDADAATRIADGRILGASAFLSLDHTDTRTGQKVGPALLHHCLTNRPHELDLDPYEEVVAATADTGGEGFVVLASPEEPVPTREELLAQLKAEHGIDVEALQAQSAKQADMATLTAALTEALRPAAGDLKLTGGDGETLTLSDVVGGVAELAEKHVALSGTVGKLQKDAAEREVDGYIGTGRLLPKSRDRAVAMVLSGDTGGLEDFLAPEKNPYVKMNLTHGGEAPQGEQKHEADIDAELTRLTATHGEFFGSGQGQK